MNYTVRGSNFLEQNVRCLPDAGSDLTGILDEEPKRLPEHYPTFCGALVGGTRHETENDRCGDGEGVERMGKLSSHF